MLDKFGLSVEEAQELQALAEQEAEQAVSDYDFVSLINSHFEQAQKVRIIEKLWRVAYADRNLDKHQEHYVRRIAELLHVDHKDYIATKLRVQAELG
ncbi:TerB family tellurite resistance protein [Alkalilimnicola ehrlichii]|uniref:tellurite resistance TerB family protein n=1 Tax=Alkalilimnicola ehrlichii TaxID=351052 RepID=UPI0015F25B1E